PELTGFSCPPGHLADVRFRAGSTVRSECTSRSPMSSDDYSVSQPAGGGFEHHAPRQRPRHARTATAKSDPTGGLEPAGDAGKARGDRRVRAARTPKTEVSADVPNSETAADPEVRLDLAPLALHLPADRFLNRELSWLDFNARVLTLAEDPTTPLL